MIIDQVLVVAGRVIIEFPFRHLLAVCAWHRYSVPMGSKIDDVEEPCAHGKELARCHVVLGLENDQKRAVFVDDAARFGPRRPTDVGMPFGVILVRAVAQLKRIWEHHQIAFRSKWMAFSGARTQEEGLAVL